MAAQPTPASPPARTPARTDATAKRRQSDQRAARAGLPMPTAAAVPTLSAPHADAQADAQADAPTEAPSVLLAYQQEWINDDSTLKVAEKGRRVGLTWAEAADDVLIAAAMGGSNVFYISATEDMAREYIEACAMWARHFNQAASEVSAGIYDDGDEAPETKRYIKTYEVTFPGSGKRIVALSSRPTNLRGKQGVIVIDEAAYAPDLAALLKAAMAMVMWGDKVRIISTHDGADNPFNELIQTIRAGKQGSSARVHTITFDRAVADGLYVRVCLRKGKPWTKAGQDDWVAEVRRMYADNAPEELDAVPSASGGAYLPLTLISARMSPATPVVRMRWDASFVLLPKHQRQFAVQGWLAEAIAPLLARMHPQRKHRFGWDFARVSDLSALIVTEQDVNLVRRVAFVLELSNCPFASQEQILWFIIDRLPRFAGGAMDAGGNGAQVAENTALKYGTGQIHQIKLSQSFYIEHMPKLKANLEDATLTDLPQDEAIQQDLRAIRVVNGVPKLPDAPTQRAAQNAQAGGAGRVQRHGDTAIAALLECYISQAVVGDVDWQAATGKGHRHEGEGARMAMSLGADSGIFEDMQTASSTEGSVWHDE